MQNRPLPNNVESEKMVLSSLINDHYQGLSQLKAEYFYRPAHKEIFNTIVHCYINSIPLDLVSLVAELEKRGTLEKAGGTIYITALINSYTANTDYYCRQLKDLYQRREWIVKSANLQQQAYDMTAQMKDIEFTIQNLLSRDMYGKPVLTIDSETTRICQQIKDEKGGKIATIGLPLDELYNRLGGLRKGMVYTIAGDTAHGKTAFLLNCISYWIKQGLKVLLCSYEMVQQNVVRLLSFASGVAVKKIFNPAMLEQEDEDKVVNSVSDLCDYNDNLKILQSPSYLDIVTMVKHWHPDLVGIDYLQRYYWRCGSQHNRGETSAMSMGRELDRLTELAQTEKFVLLPLSQLSRPEDSSKMDYMNVSQFNSRLKESGYIEQCSNAIMLLFWKWQEQGNIHQDKEKNRGFSRSFMVWLTKNTTGGGKGKMFFDIEPATQKISNLPPTEDLPF